ncbi:glycosyltransferase family 2 protein [Paracoccus aerodenitrificans]|uniref:glycosyltransferase family 2 protein n=1 Tax=Paracoccus aerodenitrificans TaxID=3017781 RepID=UPI0022F04F09|nr:glycosyltransferase family 2 protein [Paracoccus aerodenitrificans]WBU62713.1 glycosyltransferase family 2 protein [Paracoccus aerodenitrificans]
MTMISLIIPAYNEEENVRACYTRCAAVLDDLPGYEAEIIFTDNHSTDRTFPILSEIAAEDRRVRAFRFSRNVGYQNSVMFAYKATRGDCVIQLDCDLQDPPELIPEMLRLWDEGNQVVYGIRRKLPDGPLVATLRRGFYWFIDRISQDDLPRNAGEFRLTDRRVVDQIRMRDDRSPYMRGMISAMGFRQVGFEYDRPARMAGESKFPLSAMMSLAVDGLVNHSLLPLRLASTTSLVVGLITFIVLLLYLVGKLLFGQEWPPGFATLVILLLMSMTLNAMFLGILGEYIGRIFMQTKSINVPIVESTLNVSPEMIGQMEQPAQAGLHVVR